MTGHPDAQFVSWFRSVAPYFHAFRGKTFVIAFGGEVVAEGKVPRLVHDINLLHALGIRLVLVHGSRPQIEAQLAPARALATQGLRITDPVALECVKEAAASCGWRSRRCSRSGCPTRRWPAPRSTRASGNFVTAQPMGIDDGVDFQFTGSVRKVDAQAIRRMPRRRRHRHASRRSAIRRPARSSTWRWRTSPSPPRSPCAPRS